MNAKHIRTIDCPSCGAVHRVYEENGEPEYGEFCECSKCAAKLCECSRYCDDCCAPFCASCLVAPLPLCEKCVANRDVHDWIFDVGHYTRQADRMESAQLKRRLMAMATAALNKVNEMLGADPSGIGGKK